MQRHIAFLRAINVGGRTVKMDRLRGLFEEMGLANVATFIASGNVIFEAPAADTQVLERQIEAHLHGALGYEVATFVRNAAELEAIAGFDPFHGVEREGLMIAFLAAAPGEEARGRLMALRTANDDFHVRGRELYWLRRKLSESTMTGMALEKALGMPATVRNAKTVRKLAAMYGAYRDG